MPKATQQRDRDRIESIVRRIISYYVDSTEDDEISFLLLYLDGGKIPSDTAEILRPILESLADEKSESGSASTQESFGTLEQLSADVESLYEEKVATRRTLKSAINTEMWSNSEQALATRFGLELLPACDRILDLLAQEVALSDFTANEIISTFRNETSRVGEFCGRWYADCNNHDYGEEWDPDEGDQQAGRPPGEVLGIGQGFMVSYIVCYLYAARAPDGFIEFYKRLKMPHGKKVAKDVLRVFRQTTSRQP